MTNQLTGPRKRRTRQHIIADLSAHYVQQFILEEGHTAQCLGSDYGYDLILWTFSEQGYPEPGSIYFQLKAMENLKNSGDEFVYSLDIRDFNLWMWEKTPVILVLFDATRRRAYWLYVQEYFRSNDDHSPKKGAKSVRVRVPKRQSINCRAIRSIRLLKQAAQGPILEMIL
jgi:hypothetical protein